MHLENYFLPFSHCFDERNGKKPREQDIFNFLYIWDSLMVQHSAMTFEADIGKNSKLLFVIDGQNPKYREGVPNILGN